MQNKMSIKPDSFELSFDKKKQNVWLTIAQSDDMNPKNLESYKKEVQVEFEIELFLGFMQSIVTATSEFLNEGVKEDEIVE